MKKTIMAVLLGLSLCANGFAADKAAGTPRGEDKIGQAIGNFLRKLNPMPFLKEQERRYNERKAAAAIK